MKTENTKPMAATGSESARRRRQSERIKYRVLIPLALALGVLLATFAFAFWRVQQKEQAANAALSAQEVERWLRAEETQKIAVLKTTLEAVMNDGQLTEAFRQRNRAALLERVQPLFASLQSEHGIRHWYFHLPDRTVLLRAHDPGVHGDKIERHTMREAERTGKVSVGIERGLTGVFTLRVVSPWRQDGRLLGYLEMGVEFETIVKDLHKQLNEDVDFVVAVDKKYLDQEQWADAMQREGRTDDWSRFSGKVVINKTVGTLPQLAVDYFLTGNRPKESWPGGDLQMVFLRLTDVTGMDIGELIVLKNVAAQRAETSRSLRFVTAVSLAGGAAVLLFFYFFLAGVERDLSDQTAKLRKEIAQRKQAEAALRQSEDQWRLLFENNPFPAWVYDLETLSFLAVNTAAIQHYGYSRDEFLAMTIKDIRPAQDIPILLANLAAPRQTVQKAGIWRHRKKDGTLIDVEITSHTLDHDRRRAALVIPIDITERKELEAQMERLRTEHAVILNSVGEGVQWIDVEGRIKYENPASAKMLGYEAAELIGQPAHATMHYMRADGAAYPLSECPMYATLCDGVVRRATDEVFWRKDGTSFAVEYICTPVHDQNGRSGGSVVIFTDITERKLAQAELENVHQQLVEASRRGGMAEIATNVLHNVGNVLNSVNISTGLIIESVKKFRASNLARVVALLREHAPDLGEFLTHDARGKHVLAHLAQLSQHLSADQAAIGGELDELRRNVEHIKEIVVMQQSYATFGGVKEMINVVKLVEDSLRINEGSLSHHGVEVVREFEKVPSLNVEKHKILQILVNLMRNAEYACDDSGRADKRMTLRVADGEGRVKISVTDNGIGIPPENLTRIFNHGFTTRKGGHGFGLHGGALAAKEMGGSLTAQSDGPGQGASFTLELPIEQESRTRLNAA